MSFFVLDGVFDVEETSVIMWNILDYGNANKTLALRWDIFNDIGKDLVLKWDILEVTVSNSLVLKWDIRKFIDNVELELLWEILEYEIPEYQFKTEKRIKSFI